MGSAIRINNMVLKSTAEQQKGRQDGIAFSQEPELNRLQLCIQALVGLQVSGLLSTLQKDLL